MDDKFLKTIEKIMNLQDADRDLSGLFLWVKKREEGKDVVLPHNDLRIAPICEYIKKLEDKIKELTKDKKNGGENCRK